MSRRSRLINEIADRVASVLLRESYSHQVPIYDFLISLAARVESVAELLENVTMGMHGTDLAVEQAQATVRYIEHYFGKRLPSSNTPTWDSYQEFSNYAEELRELAREDTEYDIVDPATPMVGEVYKQLKNLIVNPHEFQY